ncbi:MAG: response regulator [Cyanobacteria bacterium P01_H01_bin.130]
MSPPATPPQALHKRIISLRDDQFTGKLRAQATTPDANNILPEWSLYFCMGHLFWASDNRNRNRRVLHHLSRHCSQLKQRKFALRQNDTFECINYVLLFVLLQRKVLDQYTFTAVVEDVLRDVLFEVLHYQGAYGEMTWSQTPQDPLDLLKVAVTPVNSDAAWKQALEEWKAWSSAGLGPVSPSHSLVVKEASQLQAKLGESTYQKLAIALDGRSSIRLIAQRLGQSPSNLMRSLLPYIKRKQIGVRTLKDDPDLVILSQAAAPAPKQRSSPRRVDRRAEPPAEASHGMVICIDDSLHICEEMTTLVSQAGYNIVCIQDSTQALTQLLEHKPQLVFLDLIMPVANGYEICTQIRRIAAFKDIPIIILTGSDGIIDRVRAKVVGATDFVSKPIDPDKIRALLNRYIGGDVHPTPGTLPQAFPGNA